jgi:hypothetical protein
MVRITRRGGTQRGTAARGCVGTTVSRDAAGFGRVWQLPPAYGGCSVREREAVPTVVCQPAPVRARGAWGED